MNKSISILDSVELLPLNDADVNPFLTKVRVKVFHLGENRNHSYIDRDSAIRIAKTLRGNPIVARYREEKQDFTDHGTEITINDKGVEVKSMTKPYGFIDLNAKVWFEDFDDTNEFGEVVKHTYLVTEGQIWTEQYQELKNTILDGGRPQSMELHEDTLNGYWTKEVNSKCDIFIINDAIITKLCALGEDVEPCFLGASIIPEFELSEEDGFVKELIEFKKKFQFALSKEGGLSMEDLNTPVVEESVVETENSVAENFSVEQGNIVEEASVEIENNVEEFTKKDEEEPSKDEDNKEDSDSKEEPEDNEDAKDDKEDEEKKPESKHALHSDEDFEALQSKFDELQAKFTSLEEEANKLLAFKKEVEDKQKDELINSFYMLSDEDKADVIANKTQYSLDDIEKELSVICVRKKVNFNLDEESNEVEDKTPLVYNLDPHQADTTPAWLKAVENVRQKNQ